jgi:hypothetical protein
MADPIDPDVTQAFRDFARQLDRFGSSMSGASTGVSGTLNSFGANIRQVGQGMARLRYDMDAGRHSFSESIRVYKQLKDEFENLDEATRATVAGQRIREAQQQMSSQLLRQGLGELAGDITKIGLAGALNYYKNQLVTGVRALQDNVGGTESAFSLQRQAVTDLYGTFTSLSQAATASGAALMTINPIAGGVVAGLGIAGEALAKFYGGLQTTGLDILQKEFVKTTESFKAVTGGGLLLAGGMTEIRQSAREAQLDVTDFAKVVAARSEDLARLGGTVNQGTRRFMDVNSEMVKYRNGLMNLGISYKDQADGAIEYMATLQSVGQLQGRSAAQLAKETDSYLVNLKQITAITGEDSKRAQQRARDASVQAAVQNKLSMSSGDAAVKFGNLVKQFPGLEKAISQLYTFGSVTDSTQAIFLANNPLIEKSIREQVGLIDNQNVNAARFQSELEYSQAQQAVAMRDQLRANQGIIGTVNLASGNLGELSGLYSNYSMITDRIVSKGFYSSERIADEAKKTTDPLTKSVTESQRLFTQLGTVLSALLDGPLTSFATKAPDIIQEAAKKIQEAIKPLAGQFTISQAIDERIIKIFRDAFGANLRGTVRGGGGVPSAGEPITPIQSFAGGGIANGPLSGFNALLHGTEAVIPLGDSRSIPVSMKIDENLIAKQFNESFSAAIAQIKQSEKQQQNTATSTPMESVTKALEVASSGNASFNKVVIDLKNQISDDNKQQLHVMQQQIDKMDSMISALQDNVRASENIANVLG